MTERPKENSEPNNIPTYLKILQEIREIKDRTEVTVKNPKFWMLMSTGIAIGNAALIVIDIARGNANMAIINAVGLASGIAGVAAFKKIS